jgi:anaerobic ribonucleoside-triphosphate reductase activating protein
MIKYTDTKVVFQEIPDKITLAINISNCPNSCEGCHSPQLKEDIGSPLTEKELNKLISSNKGINCVCLMGGDSDPVGINNLCKYIKSKGLCSAWYSGKDSISQLIDKKNFDYIKIGHYDKDKGPLTSMTTNQRLYYISYLSKDLLDITYKFWYGKSK